MAFKKGFPYTFTKFLQSLLHTHPMASLFDISPRETVESPLHWSGATVFGVAFAAYLLLAQLSIHLHNPVTDGGTFWPGAGLSLSLLLMLPTRQWALVILAVGLAEFGGNAFYGYPMSANFFWTLGNCVEPLIGALLLRRADNPTGLLSPLPNLMRFLAYGLLVAPLIGASIGSVGTFHVMGASPGWG